MTGARLAAILVTILIFGLTTFGMGVVVGIRMAPKGPSVSASAAAPPVAADPPPSGKATAEGRGGNTAQSGGTQATPARIAAPSGEGESPQGAPAASAMDAKGAEAKQAAPSATAASPPVTPAPVAAPPDPVADITVVEDLRSGPLPGAVAASPLRGPLVTQASALPIPPPPPATAPPLGPAEDRVFAVEVGRFALIKSAKALVDQLQAAGYMPRIVAIKSPGQPTWYIVTVGPQPDEASAGHLAESIERKLDLSAVVVSWAKSAK